MALQTGIEPMNWNQVLLGLTKRIYDNLLNNNFFPSEDQLAQTIGGETYTEPVEQRNDRVLKAKKFCFSVSSAVVEEIKANAEVDNISSSIDKSFTWPVPVVPVSSDGGSILMTMLRSNLAANNVNTKGSVS